MYVYIYIQSNVSGISMHARIHTLYIYHIPFLFFLSVIRKDNSLYLSKVKVKMTMITCEGSFIHCINKTFKIRHFFSKKKILSFSFKYFNPITNEICISLEYALNLYSYLSLQKKEKKENIASGIKILFENKKRHNKTRIFV
jgi:hypothetical protein